MCCWDLMLGWGRRRGECVGEHGWCQEQAKNRTIFKNLPNFTMNCMYNDSLDTRKNCSHYLIFCACPSRLVTGKKSIMSSVLLMPRCPEDEKLRGKESPPDRPGKALCYKENPPLGTLINSVPGLDSLSSLPYWEVCSAPFSWRKRYVKDYRLVSSPLVRVSLKHTCKHNVSLNHRAWPQLRTRPHEQRTAVPGHPLRTCCLFCLPSTFHLLIS